MVSLNTEQRPAPAKRFRWVIAGGVAVVLAGACALYRVNQDTRNAYAVWWTADVVVEHLKANDNEWPRSWSDLRDDYQTCVERSGQPWSFDELTNRTEVDWQADPAELLTQSKGHTTAQFRVITLADGTDSHWERREPNQIILDYLRLSMSDP